MRESKIKFEMMPISEVVEYGNNAKTHTPEQIRQIENSINSLGMNDPIGIDEKTKVILEGHGRLLACRNLGIAQVPVVLLGHLSQKEQRQYRLAHNKITMNTELDADILGQEMQDIENEMKGLGFPEMMTLTDEMPLDIQEEQIRPYKQIHILLSMAPEKLSQVKYLLEDILKMEGIEYEQSAN